MQKGKLSPEFILTLEFVTHLSWYGFSIVGYIFGEFLPDNIRASMGIALYALFIAMVIPEMKKSKSVAAIVIISGAINWAAKQISFLPKGWSIIIAVVGASFIGSFLMEKEGEADE